MTTNTPTRLAAIAEAVADAVEKDLARHYGDAGKRMVARVRKAILDHELPEREKPTAARETLADVAQAELLRIRGHRDLGVVTRIGMVARNVSLED